MGTPEIPTGCAACGSDIPRRRHRFEKHCSVECSEREAARAFHRNARSARRSPLSPRNPDWKNARR